MNTPKFTTKKTKRNEEKVENSNNNDNKRKKVDDINLIEKEKDLEKKNSILFSTEQPFKDEKEKSNKEEEINQTEKEKKVFLFEPNIQNEDLTLNNNLISFTEESFDTNSKNKKTKKRRIKERKKEDLEKFINKIKKTNIKDKDKILSDGLKEFIDQKYEWDIFYLIILLIIESELQNFKEFPEDYTYYVYNNLRGIKTSKEFVNIMKSPPDNKKLYEEIKLLNEERNRIFLKAAEIYNIKTFENYKKSLNNNPNANNNPNVNFNPNTNTNNNTKETHSTSNTTGETNNNINTTVNKSLEIFNSLREDLKIEIFTAALTYSSLIRNEKEQERFDKDFKKTENIKFEVLNFNLGEDSMMSILTGIKFYNNLSDINLSGNMMGPRSLFWLGSIFKTNPNLQTLDLSRCAIDNDGLYMFLEGTKFTNENLNNEQFKLSRLNLKDNNQITDVTNGLFEHPLGLILRKFQLKWLNLTNAKLKNTGTYKFLKVFLELMKEKKVYMENLILICNDFCNQDCLSLLGEIIEHKDICPLKNIILSKNLISTPPSVESNTNFFEIFMKKVAQSNIKELFLINCGIGKNENDIQILYDMLCENKSLISLRLFGNEISKMEDFSKILGLFSEYKNGLKNNTLKSLDLSKNSCNIKINEEFLQLIEKLKLEYLDINQNTMDPSEKDTFRNRTNELNDIKIIY